MGVLDERKPSGGRGCLVVGLLSLALSAVVAFAASANYGGAVAECQFALRNALPEAVLVASDSPNFLQVNGNVTSEYSTTMSVNETNAAISRASAALRRTAAQAQNLPIMGGAFGTLQVQAVEGGSSIVQVCP